MSQLTEYLARSNTNYFMWDEKRKTIWLATALVAVTLVVIPQAFEEDGRFDVGYFIQLEIIFVAVVVTMFYVYSRKH